MSQSVFERAKQHIAWDAQYSDVVCLVSTSILETGKSGVLFTTSRVYSKTWGPLTAKCKNSIFAYGTADFDFINDFDEDRMRELMSDLADISNDEDEKERKAQKREETLQTIEDVGKIAGVAALGGMAVAEIWAALSDLAVSQNNEEIMEYLSDLMDGLDEDSLDALPELIESLGGLSELMENLDLDEAEAIEFLSSLLTGSDG